MIRDYLLPYLAIGMVMLSLALCGLKYIPSKLNGWTHAIMTCVGFVLFWPAFVIHGLLVLWARKKAP